MLVNHIKDSFQFWKEYRKLSFLDSFSLGDMFSPKALIPYP